MKLRIMPKSNALPVYIALVTIPCVGFLIVIIMYEHCKGLKDLADMVLYASRFIAVYSSATIVIKIARQFLHRQAAHAFACIGVSLLTLIVNGVMLCLMSGFFR